MAIPQTGASYRTLDDPLDFIYHVSFQPEARLYTPTIKLDEVDDLLYFSIGGGVIKPLTSKAKGYIDLMPNQSGVHTVTSTQLVENSKHGNNWYSFGDVAAAVANDRWSVSLGYRLSNFDIYGSARHLTIQGRKINFKKRSTDLDIFINFNYNL